MYDMLAKGVLAALNHVREIKRNTNSKLLS